MEAIGKGWGKHVGGSDLDPKVEQAFDELNKKKNEHQNLGIINNCKSETKKLIERAQEYP